MTRLSYIDVGITEPEEGVIQFEITKDHLLLLRGMQIEWNDVVGWGGAQSNPGRPYGSVDVMADVRRLLNNDSLTEAEVQKLHKGAAMALQITLKTGKYKASTFRATRFGQDWKEVMKKKEKAHAIETEGPESSDSAEG